MRKNMEEKALDLSHVELEELIVKFRGLDENEIKATSCLARVLVSYPQINNPNVQYLFEPPFLKKDYSILRQMVPESISDIELYKFAMSERIKRNLKI